MSARPTPSRQRGFTLVELMVVCAITAVLATAMVSLGTRAAADADRTGAQVAELDDLRQSLAALEADLRDARHVFDTPRGLTITTGDDRVDWFVTPEARLARRTGDRVEHWLHRVDALAWGHAAGLVEVELRFCPKPGTARGARVTTAIAPRATRVDPEEIAR